MNARQTSQIPVTPVRTTTSVPIAAPIALALWVAMSLLLLAAPASARTESLRWTQPDASDVVRFELVLGSAPSSYTEVRNLGLPTPDTNGVYTSSFQVPDADDVYIALRAVDSAGLISQPSNEQLRVGLVVTETPPGTSQDGPSSPGALLWLDFTDSGAADDWVDTAANNSLVEQDELFSVAALGGHPALSTQSSDDDIHSHYVGSSAEVADLILMGRMAIDRAGAGVGVTAYSLYPAADVYYRLGASPLGVFELDVHPEGLLECSSRSTGVEPEPGVWYAFELVVASESDRNSISARVWPVGTTRPGAPQAECVDRTSGRPGSGRIGVWASGVGEKFWDELEVHGVATPIGEGNAGALEPPLLIEVVPVDES